MSKMSNMEIKVGDKVRVRKDAPKIITGPIFSAHLYANMEVIAVGTDDVCVKPLNKDSDWACFRYIIPTKYLVKVEDEAKEPKFKRGDKVRYVGDATEHKGKVFVIDGSIFFNGYFNQWQASSIKTDVNEAWGVCNVPLSDLEPYTEPTEEKIKVRTDGTDCLRAALDGACKPQGGGLISTSMIRLGDTDWAAYTADLAKEIAVKIVNKHMDNVPEDVAGYAVKVAKAVVEGLKKK